MLKSIRQKSIQLNAMFTPFTVSHNFSVSSEETSVTEIHGFAELKKKYSELKEKLDDMDKNMNESGNFQFEATAEEIKEVEEMFNKKQRSSR